MIIKDILNIQNSQNTIVRIRKASNVNALSLAEGERGIKTMNVVLK
jgi:hypothetical protein